MSGWSHYKIQMFQETSLSPLGRIWGTPYKPNAKRTALPCFQESQHQRLLMLPNERVTTLVTSHGPEGHEISELDTI